MKPAVPSSRKGILKAEAGMQNFTLLRYPPSEDLAFFVEHYWIVRWDLRGQAPYRQDILSYPNLNLVFENVGNEISTLLYGVPRKTYTRTLQDKGIVVGIKFRHGGFYPFWQQPVSRLTGQALLVKEALGIDIAAIEEEIFAQTDEERMACLAEQFLRERLPEPDGNVILVNRIVQAAMEDRNILRVEDLSSRFDIGTRTLQRLFSRYVGVSPKWVIQRYRLQEAAELLEKGEAPGWLKLSQDLGYYDQAHFNKDFKAMIGKSPEEFRKELAHE